MVLLHRLPLGLRREMLVGCVLGRVDLIRIIDAVLVSAGRLWRVQACLDKVLSLSLGDERLQLRGRESVDQAGLRHH